MRAVCRVAPRLAHAVMRAALAFTDNPLFWTDVHPTRNLTAHPPEMPNLEGGIVLDWLAYPHLADACRLFTASPAKRGNAPYHQEIMRARARAGFQPHNLLDPHNGSCPEPTIYFELGCSRSARPTSGSRVAT